MKLYTKTGDSGKTSIIGGRVDKDDIRVEAYGTIDELNSFVGKAVSEMKNDNIFENEVNFLLNVQSHLFDCGVDLSNVSRNKTYKMKEEYITALEEEIDKLSELTPPIEYFILPGGSPSASTLHIARTVTRRAERLVVALMKEKNVDHIEFEKIQHIQLVMVVDEKDKINSDLPLIYLNRLSDYFFILSRYINHKLGATEPSYNSNNKVFK